MSDMDLRSECLRDPAADCRENRMNEQVSQEFRSLLGAGPLTSAQIMAEFTAGKFLALMGFVQTKAGVLDRGGLSTNELGTALRHIATETCAIEGKRGGADKSARWSLVSKPVVQSKVPQFSEHVIRSEVSCTKGLDAEEANPRVDPSTHEYFAPRGYHIKGASTLKNAEGKVIQQWVKTVQDPEGDRMVALFEELKKLPEGYADAHVPTVAPSHLNEDLLCVIPMGDPHLGLHCWGDETGSNYDISIAEKVHVDAIRKLISVVPSAKQALIVSLGDLLHCDSNSSRTSRSGAQLDVDTRWQKVMRVGVRMMRAMIDISLTKFDTVRVICEVGNHDDLSSIMMAMMLDAFYSKDHRVVVDTSPAPFHYFRFGKNLIGTTHGAETKPEQLPMIMAADRPEDWGATEHRRWLCGHVHHESVREFPGVTAEWFRTLAPRDAWANAKGYRAGRDMRCDVLHREHGFVSRYAIGVNQLDV
jgi:hypothetical protein